MCVIDNPYEFTEAQKLLKQMEVEQMNHMSNDQIKKRVSLSVGVFTNFAFMRIS